jgi:hypothetical protein
VPLIAAVDEMGIVRTTRLDPARVVEDFLAADFEELGTRPAGEPRVRRELLASDPLELSTLERADWGMARWLWPEDAAEGELDLAVEFLAAASEVEDAGPEWLFRRGVAERLRYDRSADRASDLQASFDHWTAALRRDPAQYIWRRRIQQYGPRLDKPYPFYDWVESARQEILARGEKPQPLRVRLTATELSGAPGGSGTTLAGGVRPEPPDPDGRLPRDTEELVRLDVAAAVHTGGGRAQQAARAHILLRPSAEREVHWANEAGPSQVWLEPPAGWTVERPLLNVPSAEPGSGEGATSTEVRALDFELVCAPGDASDNAPSLLRGYAVYFVCQGKSGECSFLRQDFVIPLESGE